MIFLNNFCVLSYTGVEDKVQQNLMSDVPIKLYWWKCRWSKYGNFGDELSAKIILKIFNKKVEWATQNDCEMIACGSIIEHINSEKIKDKIVWTSGFRLEGDSKIEGNKIVGVRGKLSESRVEKTCGQDLVLGDLGLLSSNLLIGKDIQKKYKVGIVPHLTEIDDEIFKNEFFENESVKIINPLDECEKVIEDIAQCDTVLSSSLHGLIVADSLNIPNCYFQIRDRKKAEGMYKYYDYYSVFSQDRLKIVNSNFFINNDLQPEMLKYKIICEYISADDEVAVIKKNLIDSFEKVASLVCG